MTIIGNGAFCKSSLQSIDIPNKVTTIGNQAFCFCSKLESIDIPNSVTKIGEKAFESCSLLKDIHLHWTQIDKIQVNDSAFKGIKRIWDVNFEECILYIPPGTRWAYRHHPVFGLFKNIVTISATLSAASK